MQMGAPNGQHARRLLENLDLKAIRALLAQQVDLMTNMSTDELDKAMSEEIKFLIE